MKLRKIIFWLHLGAGVFAGIVVLIMSITGVALTYQKQMTEWADRPYWPASSSAGGERLTVDNLILKVREAKPDAKPSAITFYSDPNAPAMVTIGTGRTVFVSRYTGEVGGEGSPGIRSFFRVMTTWHRYVGAGDENRAIGKAITGACNLAFLFIVVSGLYLWLPRKWTAQVLRGITWFKGGLTGKARDFNWHNAIGFWTAVPLFFVVLSATVISYPWATSLVYRITGTQPPAPAAPQQQAPAPTAGASAGAPADFTMDFKGIDALLSRAEQEVPGWRTINLRVPASADAPVTFTIDRGYGGQPQLRSTLALEQQTGQLVSLQSFSDQNLGQRVRSWMRFVHTGEFYGLLGQTIAGVASAAGVALVYTGLSLAFRRLLAWIGRKRRPQEGYAGVRGGVRDVSYGGD